MKDYEMFEWLKKRKKITILGSCVSRDIMEYIDSDRLEIGVYIARTKVASQLSSSLNVEECQIDLSSAFQKRLVLNDLNKTTFDKLNNLESEFCVIDYIDERFKLIKINDSYITKSNEILRSNWLPSRCEEMQYSYENGQWLLEGENLDTYLKKYLDKVVLYFKPNNIILHKAYMVNSYLDKEKNIRLFDQASLKANEKVNEMLDYMYNFTENYLEKAKIIDLCNKYVADEENKWGLATMHYQKEYYVEAAKMVCKYMKL